MIITFVSFWSWTLFSNVFVKSPRTNQEKNICIINKITTGDV